MTRYPSKSKTVLWVLLTGVGFPALVYAGERFAAGDPQTAVFAAAIGALGLVLFAISYLAEFPGEEQAKDAIEDLNLSDEDVERLTERFEEVVEEAQPSQEGDT